MRIGILASHNGSNAQAIIDACKAGVLDAQPVVMISNNSDSGASARARREGIPCHHLSGRTHAEPRDLDRVICETLEAHDVQLVVLAGYMKRLGPNTLARFENRIVNIHPALLPNFGGQGMYGIRVHEAVLASGATETGVTIHLVDADYDHGPILAQRRIPIQPDDTPETLAKRVLGHEHEFFVESLQKIEHGEIELPAIAAGE